MDNILKLKCNQLCLSNELDPTNIYIWSDFHFNDPTVMAISDRPYYTESTIIPGLKIPSPEAMQKYIIKKITSLPKGSILFNLGDIGKLTGVEDEKLFTKLNKDLHDKGIKHFLILGNHDFLDNNLIYSPFAGNEVEFYKKLGFDEVFLNTVGCVIQGKPFALTHKPLTSTAFSLFSDALKANSIGKNIHGHWHTYNSKSVIGISTCVDIIDEPMLLNNLVEKPITEKIKLYTANIPDNGFMEDPWL